MMKLVELRDRFLGVLVEIFYRLILASILIVHSVYVLVAPTRGINSVTDILADWRKIA